MPSRRILQVHGWSAEILGHALPHKIGGRRLETLYASKREYWLVRNVLQNMNDSSAIRREHLEQVGPKGTGPSEVLILRDRLQIVHTAPAEREMENELTLLNIGEEPIDRITMTRTRFMPGLKIYDSDGTILPLFPNQVVRAILRQGSQDYKELLSQMEKHERFVMMIPLPPSNPLAPKECRVIRLVYHDEDTPGTIPRWRSIFNSPVYHVEKDLSSTEDYLSFIELYAPPGYELRTTEKRHVQFVNSEERVLGEQDRYHYTPTRRSLSVSVPGLGNRRQIHFHYAIVTDPAEAWLVRIFLISMFLLSAIIALSVSHVIADILARNLQFLIPSSVSYHLMTLGCAVADAVKQNLSFLAPAFVALAGAFIGFARNPLTHRTKYFVLLFLALPFIAMLIG